MTSKNKLVEIDVYGIVEGPKNHLVLSDKSKERFLFIDLSLEDTAILQRVLEGENTKAPNPYIEVLEDLGWSLKRFVIVEKSATSTMVEMTLVKGEEEKVILKDASDMILWAFDSGLEILVLEALLNLDKTDKDSISVQVSDAEDDFKLTQRFLF